MKYRLNHKCKRSLKQWLKKSMLLFFVLLFAAGPVLNGGTVETVQAADENTITCPKPGYDTFTSVKFPIDGRNSLSLGNPFGAMPYASSTTLVLTADSPLLAMFGGSMPVQGKSYDVSAYLNDTDFIAAHGSKGIITVPFYNVSCSLCGANHEYYYGSYGQRAQKIFVATPVDYNTSNIVNFTITKTGSEGAYTYTLETGQIKKLYSEVYSQITDIEDRISAAQSNGASIHSPQWTIINLDKLKNNYSHSIENTHGCGDSCRERLHTHKLKYDTTKAHTGTCTYGKTYTYGDLQSLYYEKCTACGTVIEKHEVTGYREYTQSTPSGPVKVTEPIWEHTYLVDADNHTYTWYETAADSCYTLDDPHCGSISEDHYKDDGCNNYDAYCSTCDMLLHVRYQPSKGSAYSYYCESGMFYMNIFLPDSNTSYTNNGTSMDIDYYLYGKKTLHRPVTGPVCGELEWGDKCCDKVVTKLIPFETEQTLGVGDTINEKAYAKFLDQHIEEVTCQITGYNPAKYNEWQTVTLAYGYTSVSDKTPFGTTIQVYLERTDADLTLKVDPEGAGKVNGAGTYQVGTENVTASTTGNQGYTFDGWYENGTLVSDSANYSFTMPGEDRVLTAKYTPNTYAVNRSSEYTSMGTVSGPTSAQFNSSVTVTATPKSGYVFAGWYNGVKKESDSASYTFTMPNYDVTLVARFTPPYYTVSFNSNGGSSCSAMDVLYLGTYGNLPTPTKSGYLFVGWKYNGAYITPLTPVTTKSNHTLVAEWAEAGPEFIFVDFGNPYGKNSWSLDSANVGKFGLTTALLGNKLPLPSTAYKIGYDFKGWYRGEDTKGNGSGTKVAEATVMNTKTEHTLHAQWTPKTYTLSFDANGGSSCSAINVTYDRRYGYHNRLPQPTKTGYVFAGWFTTESDNNGYGTQIEDSTRVQAVANQTLYAKWVQEAVNITVTFSASTKEQAGLTAAESTASGHGSTIGTLSGTSAFSLTYPGTYGKHPVTWCSCEDDAAHTTANGWKEFGNQHYYIDTTKTAGYSFPTPTRTGYTFDNYWETGDGTKVDALTDNVVVEQSHTLYAHYTPKKYTVTFNPRGATSTTHTPKVTMTFDSACPLIVIPEKRGYTFKGYYTGIRGTGKQYYDEHGTGVASWTEETVDTLYAYWEQTKVQLPEEDEYTEPMEEEPVIIEGNVARTDAKGLLYSDDYDDATGALDDLQLYLTYDTPAGAGRIPGTEKLSFRARMGSWLLNYKFSKHTGRENVKIIVTVPYRTQHEVSSTEELVISGRKTKDYMFFVPKTWSYWEVVESGMYYADSVTIANEMFKEGNITVKVKQDETEQRKEIDYSAVNHGDRNEHVNWPEYDADGTPVLTLELMEEQYIISEKPDVLPDVDAHNRIIAKNAARADEREARVRSDLFKFDGKILLSDEWRTKHGATPDEVNLPKSEDAVELTSYLQTYTSGICLGEEKPNGTYKTSATITYVGDASNVGTEEAKTMVLSDINDINIHTPVACNALITDGVEYIKEDGKEHALLTLKEALNFFTLLIDNTGTHVISPGYGRKNFADAFSGKSNIAMENKKQLNQVQFPFAVYVDEGDDSLKPDGSRDTAGDYLVKAGEWITTGVESQRFYLPVTAKNGKYTINFRSIAVNCPTDKEGKYQTENHREDKVNLNPENYVATDSLKMEINSYIKEFRITSVEDPRAAADLERGSETITLKKGYGFTYRLLTQGEFFGENAEAEIIPSYYWEPEEGGSRQEAVLYRMEKLTANEKRECYAWDSEPLLLEQKYYDVILQKFSGKGIIPADAWCVLKDKTAAFEAYAAVQTLTGKESFFMQNGNLIISFDIRVKSNQGKWYFFETGDVIRYDLSKCVGEDYEVGGME